MTLELAGRRTVDWTRALRLAWLILWTSGAGILVASVALRFAIGGWPPHDTIAYFLAGSHLAHGELVYANATGAYLAFWYGPPWAVLWAPLSYASPYVVPAAVWAAQVMSLRYVAGSWKVALALGWIPGVRYELFTGNVNLVMAAVIWASVREVRGAGYGVALFALAKLSPVLLLLGSSWRQRREAAIGFALLALLTVPFLFLWPQWVDALRRAQAEGMLGWIPLAPRIPVVLVLLALRRPWALAAATALATPSFYEMSVVLLFPAARLVLEPWIARHQLTLTTARRARAVTSARSTLTQ